MPNYNSIYLNLAGSSRPWYGGDSAELYQRNVLERREYLAHNGWLTTKIIYKFNSNGFRCDEFTSEPTALFLGCSLTMGIGLPVEVLWPSLVAEDLGLRSANLGQGGGSADTAFRLCLGWIDQIQPKIVVYLKPPRIRWEIITNNSIIELGIDNMISGYNADFAPYMRTYTQDDNNDYFNDQKNTRGIQSICNERGIPLFVYDAIEDFYPLTTVLDLARDCNHPGVQAHQVFAQKVLKDIHNGSR